MTTLTRGKRRHGDKNGLPERVYVLLAPTLQESVRIYRIIDYAGFKKYRLQLKRKGRTAKPPYIAAWRVPSRFAIDKLIRQAYNSAKARSKCTYPSVARRRTMVAKLDLRAIGKLKRKKHEPTRAID